MPSGNLQVGEADKGKILLILSPAGSGKDSSVR